MDILCPHQDNNGPCSTCLKWQKQLNISREVLNQDLKISSARNLELELENIALTCTLEAIKRRCKVIFFPISKSGAFAYPIEHNPHANKDNWDTILAELAKK